MQTLPQFILVTALRSVRCTTDAYPVDRGNNVPTYRLFQGPRLWPHQGIHSSIITYLRHLKRLPDCRK